MLDLGTNDSKRTRRHPGYAIAILTLLAATSGCGARTELADLDPVDSVATVRPGDVHTGVLEASDLPSVRGGRRVEDVERIRLSAGEIVTVLMCGGARSDTYLLITAFEGDGRVLASNDDSSGTLNSRIVFTAPSDGVFVIHLTTYRDSVPTGTEAMYTVSIFSGSHPDQRCS